MLQFCPTLKALMFLFLKQSSLHGMKCNKVEPNSRSNLHPPSDQTSTHGNPISSMDLIIHHNHRIYNTTLKSTNSFSYTHSHTPKLYYHSTMQVGGGSWGCIFIKSMSHLWCIAFKLIPLYIGCRRTK